MKLYKTNIKKDAEKEIKEHCFLGIRFFKTIQNNVGKKYKIGNLSVFKIRETPETDKYYILGIPFLSLRKDREHNLNVYAYQDSDIPEKIKFEKNNDPLVSIIIPVYNQISYTKKCLYSILKSEEKVKFEIIIADDSSTDGTMKISDFAENIIISRNSGNVGYIKNCNQAASLAKGKFLYFLDNDTQVQKNWLSALLTVFEENENVGVVGSKILDPDGRIQECGVHIYRDEFINGSGRAPSSHEYNYLKECDYVSGCSLMTPKDLFFRIGGFDEIYSPGFRGDSDYCFHAGKLNYKTFVQPRSYILHYGSISYQEENTDLHKRNKKILREKWPDFFDHRTSFATGKLPFTQKTRPGKIVVVDSYFPEYDRHAGGKSLFQFIQMFIKMGLHVKYCPLLSVNLEEPYNTVLSNMGIEIIPGYKIHQWIEKNYDFLDYLFLSRPDIANRFNIRSLRDQGVKVLYYGQDFHYLRMSRENSLMQKYTSHEIEGMKKMELSVIESSDISYYPSSYEIEQIRTFLPDAKIRQVPVYLYDIQDMPVHKDFENSREIIFVGSAHGPNLDGLKWFLNDIYPYITDRIPDLVLNIVGSSLSEEIRSISSKNVIVHSYISEEELSELYASSRLSIAPLRYGAGIKGKVIEAIFHGTPVLTTPIGAEGLFVDGEIIRVATDARNFADTFLEMYFDENLWIDLTRKCQNFIHNDFTFARAEAIFKDDIDNGYYSNE